MSKPLGIIIVDKPGTLKYLVVKDFKTDEIYKKCGFKKDTGFALQHTWNLQYDNVNYSILVYAKEDGKANSENKYEFPPPIANKLFFGKCAILGKVENNYENLSLSLWKIVHEQLFGGFEDIVDESDTEDELDKIPKQKLTKDGYLKDGFVVDSDDETDQNMSNDIGSELSEELYEDTCSEDSHSEDVK